MSRSERRATRGSALGRIEIVEQGEAEAVVFKPAGLSSERPQSGGRAVDSLIDRVRVQLGWPDARLPHRLDRPTRGLVMVARDAARVADHAAEIRAGAWTKWYIARIPARGGARAENFAKDLAGPHKAYLRREGARARVVRAGGDPSRLTVLAVAPARDRPDHSHALILLETGRFHQIRAMLAHLGFPLVGDELYGGTRAAGAAGASDLGGSDLGAFDLEAIALEVKRDGASAIYRLREHPDRVGVADEIERALDEAISAPRGRS